jgi:UDP-N-acetyl-D-glucosamine dehydrogenase
MNVTVIGQGYVGLPLAMNASGSGYIVFGLDLDEIKVGKLLAGKSQIEDVPDSLISERIKSGLYFPTVDERVIKQSDVVVLCVPTPVHENGTPDLSALISAATTAGRHLKSGSLVLIESTIEPGTTRDLLLPVLVSESKLGINEFYLAYSPERIDPNNKEWSIENTPKLIAGYSIQARDKAKAFYEKFVDDIVICSSLEVAETAKLLENSFRLINISFINEISVFCRRLNIDINEVISAAATKPYGFMPFYPSIGVGGHCIPVDPLYLAHKAKIIGTKTKMIDLANQINIEMPKFFADIASEMLRELVDKKILIIGISYKVNISDVRETPVANLISELQSRGARVEWHDDLVKEWNSEKSVALSDKYDLAILATPHDYLDLTKLGDVPILNTRGSI